MSAKAGRLEPPAYPSVVRGEEERERFARLYDDLVRVIGLAPSSDAQLIFRGLLQENAFEGTSAGAEAGSGRDARAPLPTTLLLLAGLSLLALGLHERFGGRLAITRGEAGEAA